MVLSSPKTGESILHLAAKYDRAGQNHNHFMGRDIACRIDSQTENDSIVKWLLANPDFAHVASTTKSGETALHSAVGATLPDRMSFASENYRGWLKTGFVTHGSLVTLLADDDIARRLINVPDTNGRSPLVLAMSLAAKRHNLLEFLRASNGKLVKDYCDTSLNHYVSDYSAVIETLMNNKYLRLHSVFGVTESSSVAPLDTLDNPPPLLAASQTVSSIVLCRFRKATHDGLRTLSSFCDHDRHAPAVEKMLSDNSGKVLDEKKAKVSATCVDHLDPREWWFKPYGAFSSKEIGTVFRKFYVRHSRHCVDALEATLAELHFETSELLLLRIRVKVMRKFMMDSPTMNLILRFAGCRESVSSQVSTLSRIAYVLNTDVAGFFFGGIESCLSRKYGINSKVWKMVLEFAGFRREMPSIALLPKSADSKSRKRKRQG